MNGAEVIYASFDACAIVLSLIVVINYFISKRFHTRTALFFQLLAIFSFVYSALSFSYLVLRCVYACPTWLRYVLLVAKYLFGVSTCLIFLCYSVSVIYENKKLPVSLIWITSVIGVIGLSSVIATGLALLTPVLDGLKLASVCEGLIYGSQICALVSSLIYTIVNRKVLRPMQQLNVYYFTALSIVSSVVQYLVHQLQICGFAYSIAILLIYVTLQRPEDEIDADTGMFNYKTFVRRASTLIKAGRTFYLFVAELKNMSIVNSTFGMQCGNEVIKETSRRLKAIIGKKFYLYRLSGVKFGIIFNDEKEYKEFERQYAKMFDQLFEVNGTKIQLNALAVLIRYPEVTDKLSDVDDIVRYYRSSANSNDLVIFAEREAIEKNGRREQIDYAVQNAIANHTFEVYYQPIYSVRERKFNSCEALVRLKDPELGFISPDEFIPIAEQNGSIIEVGRQVIEKVCRFLTEEQPEKYGLEFVDINLSVIQCMHPEIIQDIENTLDKYHIPRSKVNLEVTETASAQSYALLQRRLNELHSNGFTISLDDFGTGFSSVEYLIKFPFDIVKLDKSLVWAYMSTEKYEPILHHYMPMLHGLGTKIVAEGVETAEMVEKLTELGCDYLQGFYYSRPVPKEKFMEFLVREDNVKTA